MRDDRGPPDHDLDRLVIECERCGLEFDGTHYRWLCPGCKQKADCCSGSPQPIPGENKAWMQAEQERRRSSVAQPHRNRKKYYRPSERTVED